ncbi:hypothetical protein QQF64_034397, partial [Cirrhinus molitorella]
SPTVKVSPDVIRESSSVKISCEMTPVLFVNQCYFYPNREEKKIKASWKCELELSGAEVFTWAAVKSSASLNIYCYYTIKDVDKPSAHSPPATVKLVSSLDLHPTTELSTSMTNKTMVSPTNSTLLGNSRMSEHNVLDNKQQKEGNTEENEIVYHLYCTIPDKPVRSNAEDQV